MHQNPGRHIGINIYRRWQGFARGCWHSIRTRLIVLLTLVVTIVYSTVAFIEVADELYLADIDLHRQIDVLSNVQAEALSVPLWNFDREEVERQLDVLIANRDIVAARVLDNSGKAFASAKEGGSPSAAIDPDHDTGSDGGPPPRGSMTWDLITALIEHQADLVESKIKRDGGGVIGTLQVGMTHSYLAAVQRDLVWSHFRQFLVITLVLAGTIGVAVTRLVRPVSDITKAMDKIAAGDLNATIPATDRPDEIGMMARALEVFKANSEQLQLALTRERELNGLQRQFISMVSHEFRTPLSIIDGNAHRMIRRLGQLSTDRLHEGLSKVRRSVVRLTELMESVLNAARLEEGRIAFEPQTCSLPEILTELVCSYADLNQDREIFLQIDGLPNAINADPKLLRQVFSNLLSNACKYSGKGSNVWIEGRQNCVNAIAVSVRDEGVGIPSDELPNLFERFFRASTSTGIAGTGIGLHLVQHFVDLHDGKIDVTSTVGQGTEFIVHLPFRAPTPAVRAFFDDADPVPARHSVQAKAGTSHRGMAHRRVISAKLELSTNAYVGAE